MTWPHLGKAATVLVAASTEIGHYFGPLLWTTAMAAFSGYDHPCPLLGDVATPQTYK